MAVWRSCTGIWDRAICRVMLVLWWALATTFAGPSSAQDTNTLVLSGFVAPALTPRALAQLQPAYAELGIKLEVDYDVPSRSLVQSTTGKTDGEVIRIQLVGDRHPSLLRVNVPLITVAAYGYTNRPELKSLDLDHLRNLRAGHVLGALFGETAAEGFAEVWSAEEPEQLFTMLNQGRLDIVFVRESKAKELIARFGMDSVYPIPSTYRAHSFYHYLHERHRDLVPRIESVLRKRVDVEDETEDGKRPS